MSNKNKKIVSIIGIIVGIAIVIIGFFVQDTHPANIGEGYMKFGADFYTEIYDVTRDVGMAITHSINDLISAISWLIVSIGAIDICFFSYLLAKASKTSDKNSNTAGGAISDIDKKTTWNLKYFIFKWLYNIK